MQRLWWLCVLVLIGACGQNRQGAGQWPATLTSVENFSGEQKTMLLEAIRDLNTHVGKTIVDIDGSATKEGYPLNVELVDPWTEAPARAGYATVEDPRCLVQISKKLFGELEKSYFRAVVWHEIGHCTGLAHVDGQSEIMYKASKPFADYTEDALKRFLQQLIQAAGI